ncbi:MAG: alpha/beta fold hydrolase [Verrucomicrobia bacterium]|nr:alpha/beta fold hydrolase [Verrucomicrobiota bacterium]MDA1086003.1 alpha/beta fold hydrolase [Verrucomicrobiota bacterium]
MAPTDEHQVLFAGGVYELHGMLYPHQEKGAPGIVICHPLFEERKSAHRALVEAARAFCSAGFSVLRFDYRGCGNSHGTFRDFGLDDWAKDIRAAAGFLATQGGCPRIGLMGLRLGASLAFSAASSAGATFVVGWEPVIDGTSYFQQELRKKLMKQMMTYGENQDSRAALADAADRGEDIDFDGYALSPRLYRELTALDLRKTAHHAGLPVLLSAVTHNAKPSAILAEWTDLLRESSDNVDVHGFRLPPFWNLVGLTDCSELIAETITWLQKQKNPSTS